MGTSDADARVKELEEEIRRKDAETKQKEEAEKLKKEEQKRKKNEEAERKREEQKGDPIFQAKQFGKQLLHDIVQCKESCWASDQVRRVGNRLREGAVG